MLSKIDLNFLFFVLIINKIKQTLFIISGIRTCVNLLVDNKKPAGIRRYLNYIKHKKVDKYE